MSSPALPGPGLYDPRYEHDACGVGFVANIKGTKSHSIIRQGLQVLTNLDHRGAVGADPEVGDGSGCLIQTPHMLLHHWAQRNGHVLPEPGQYGVAMCFLPQDKAGFDAARTLFEKVVVDEGQKVMAWRHVPTNPGILGKAVRANMPQIWQAIVLPDDNLKQDQDAFERKLFVIQRQIENGIDKLAQEKGLPVLKEFFYMPSFSTRTVVYKGLILAPQLGDFYKDLHNDRTRSAIALVHQRFSTNTFPSWRLAHPYRAFAHNGEINTNQGNVNWMRAREGAMQSDLLGDDLTKLYPYIPRAGVQSDTANIDDAFKLLTVAGGYSAAEAMMMLIPEALGPHMDPARRAFYEYNAAKLEPWDGPAAIAFTDGRQIGATLDRNGLRPARYMITDDDTVIMASEAGVLPIPEDKISKKWRNQPGKMLLIDLEQGRIIEDDEIKAQIASTHDYATLVRESRLKLADLPATVSAQSVVPANNPDVADKRLLQQQQMFGQTQEDLQFFLEPMGKMPDDPVGSMGTDTPIAALSNQPKRLYNYFKQVFAQVTNPPIDSIREELVMSLTSLVGPRPNLLDRNAHAHPLLELKQPILTDEDLEKIRAISDAPGHNLRARTLDATWPADQGAAGMEAAVERLSAEAAAAVKDGINILIVSDRAASNDRIPIPSLLATSAVHHHLIREQLRTKTGLVVETGDACQVHHFSVLAGYGAEAINPYLAFQTLEQIRSRQGLTLSADKVQENFIKGSGKGILKVMSKMGISTYQSYCGAQIFDAVGLQDAFVDHYFEGTASRIKGAGIFQIAQEAVARHQQAFGDDPQYRELLDVGGDYALRTRGEDHAWTAQAVTKLREAARTGSYATYQQFAKEMNDQDEQLLTIRGLMKFKFAPEPIPAEEVEPIEDIVRRFATGAMSFGSISREAHTTLAIAMNRLGGKSNTGEGGEEPERFVTLPNGDSKRSAIKQVASGRFGVTAEYLANADMLQIKMAQGAKPGEGGQLPGKKVSEDIAKVRKSTAGVGLISPPPHHDIYSIEDLAQLIHDLKNANPKADVSVKLVSEVGVGTVAAGVAKARADHVTISGFEGGTGASPLTSLTHAGSPWEIGLSETQQTLVRNGLRGRITVQVDGGLRTGKDVVIGALLGADEFGFATAPLIASGCIMMRKCHLDTCPVGIATQNPELRARFPGTPEHVMHYFSFVAEEVREIMAELGVRKLDDLIGHTEMLDMRKAVQHWKAQDIDLSRVLYQEPANGVAIRHCEVQDHHLDKALDNELITAAEAALERRENVVINDKVRNVNRTVGAMLSGEVAKFYGHEGLPEDTIQINLGGTAGQSFGAFLAHGVTLRLTGDTNDYAGKGLSGGLLIVRQSKDAKEKRDPTENIVVGNTVLYGATAGEAYFEGVAGERFAVRNSGAVAVVEGTGDHGCEYMTGGVVVVLGETGRNFAAGMSGGIAYVYDPKGMFRKEHKFNPAGVDIETHDMWDQIGPVGHEGRPHQRAIDVNNAGMGDLLAYHPDRIKIVVERHRLHTESERAKAILGDWDNAAKDFVLVMPKEFRAALLQKRADQASQRTATGYHND